MTIKFAKTFKTIRPGDRYAATFFIGHPVPDDVMDEAIEAGVTVEVEDKPSAKPVDDAVTDDVWTKDDVNKAKKADLIALVADDPDFNVEGFSGLKVDTMRTVIIAHYFE